MKPAYEYDEILKNTVFHLTDPTEKDVNIAKLINDGSTEELENYILECKKTTEEKEFYYAAGVAIGQALSEAKELDPFSICLWDIIYQFEELIGCDENG